MVALPVAEILARRLGTRVPGALAIVQYFTLWVGFLGAAIAAREDQLLQLATGNLLPEGRFRDAARVFTGFVSATVATVLCWASVSLVANERSGGNEILGPLEVWMAQLVLPVGLALLALRHVLRASPRPIGRMLAGSGIVLGLVLARNAPALADTSATLPLVVLLVATTLGAPIYVAIGGAALTMFVTIGSVIEAMPAETVRLAVSPTLAAIPLFTLTGMLLAEGRAPARMLRVFRAAVGWLPGGTAIVCVVVCAFFTVFTGGSGVTILALGGLLFQALQQDGYRERFSLGLLTASGSIGLLWPPALPLILYGIVAEVSIPDLFIGGLLPGLLLVGLVSALGAREGLRSTSPRPAFSAAELAQSAWSAKWELLLPVAVLVSIFSGWATIVESAAVSALYAAIAQIVVYRDLSVRRDLVRVRQKCAVMVGGVLIILGVSMGLTSWMVEARVPQRLVELVSGSIDNRLVFLLLLNLFLLLVGCLMDIFSATVVVVALFVPLGLAFGVDPIHLGIIFIANLELGYLTPPVGLNLYLASYRFERPLLEIYRAAVPMLIVLGVGVLLITYLPWLTLGLLDLLGRR